MLVLLFTLWLPWNLFWVPTILRTPVNMDAQTVDTICGGHIACASDLGPIFISPNPKDWATYGGLKRIVNHELQHHLGFTSGLYDRADWNEFCGIIAEMILYGDYDEHQRGTMRATCYDPLEMHAELPILLRGEIPEELAAWYPWFNLGEDEYAALPRPEEDLILAER